MTSWSIDPAGVVKVLTSVQEKAEALGTTPSGLEPDFTAALTATQSQAIADAVSTWMGTESPALEKVSQRITAGMTGASEATTAYVNGDLEMAADQQSYQVKAATLGPNWNVNKGMF